jgi:hypothetical protein
MILAAAVFTGRGEAQSVAVKTNLLYDLTSTINLGLEIGLSPKWTLELPVNYNPWNPIYTGHRAYPGEGGGWMTPAWTPGNTAEITQVKADAQTYPVQLRHWLIQPEARYWFCNRFEGHFLGIHGIVGGFNVGGIKLFGWDDDPLSTTYGLPYRYQGEAYGGGVSYGYHWVLSNRLSIEATLGLGLVFFDGKKYSCPRCGSELEALNKTYVGPTKAAVSLIYMIK